MRKFKIAFLSYRSAPFSGGQGIYVYELSRAFKDLGHEVDIISGPPYPKLADGINLIKLPGLDLFSTFNFRDRLNLFFNKKNKDFDDYYEFFIALIGGFPEMRTFGNRAKNYLSTRKEYDFVIDNQSLSYAMIKIQEEFPLFQVIHHPIPRDKEYELKYAKGIVKKTFIRSWYSFLKMQSKVAPKMHNIISPSKSSKNDIQKYFHVDASKIHVIPNGIDTGIFKPNLMISKKPFKLITTASADVPLKGLDFTLRAIAIAKDKYPLINLVVIGKPRSGGHTERLISKLGIDEFVSFKTNLTNQEVSDEYASSQIAIVSSLYEGFGFPVGEAMACAVPLIATDVASIPEITGPYAEMIAPESHEDIFNSLDDIFQNYDHYMKKANLGRDHILQNFSWSVIANSYIDHISSILTSHADI